MLNRSKLIGNINRVYIGRIHGLIVFDFVTSSYSLLSKTKRKLMRQCSIILLHLLRNAICACGTVNVYYGSWILIGIGISISYLDCHFNIVLCY